MSVPGPSRRRPPAAALRRFHEVAPAAAWQLGALTVAATLLTCAAGAQELRYSITPTAERLRFDEALGLDNTYLYGGRAGVLFGRLVELQGFYLTSRGTEARVATLYDRLNLGGQPPQNAGLDVSTYGANLVLNFGTGVVTPFVRGGGSIVRFAPEGARATERIALQYAGGLRLGRPGGIRLSAFAEDVRFRVDRTLLLAVPAQPGGAAPFDGDAGKLRSNIAYGAGLTIPLGGAVGYDDRPSSSLSNLSLPLDAFAGVLDWSDATGLKAQNIAGVRTGIDFGPLVGLRAYYWRGVDGDFSRRDGVQSWGAEAQFNLNAGSGVTPFVLGGAGQVDFTGAGVRAAGSAGGADSTRLRPVDRTALIVGGGVKLPLTEFLSITAAARNYVTTRDSARLQDVNGTGQLRSNWQYTAGLSLGLGRRGPSAPAVARARTDTVYLDPSGRRVAARADSTRARDGRTLVVTARGDTLRGAEADSALGRGAATRVQSARAGEVDPAVSAVSARDAASSRGDTIAPRAGEVTYATDRTVAVVVPREGEITVRYGPQRPAEAAPRSDADLRDEIAGAVRTAVREELGPTYDAGRADGRSADRRATDSRQLDVVPNASARRAGDRAPAAMTRDDIRAEIRAAIRDELTAAGVGRNPTTGVAPRTSRGDPSRDAIRKSGTPAAGATASEAATSEAEREAEYAARERRLLESVDARVAERLAAHARADAEARERAAAERRASDGEVTRDVRAAAQPSERRTRAFAGATLYSGGAFSGGAQALLGGRVDLGEISPSLPGFRLVPEVAFGTGAGGTTTLVAANATYMFGGVRLGVLGQVRPQLGVGVGLLNFGSPVGGRSGTDLVLNPAYGLTAEPVFARPLLRALTVGGTTPALLIEHQGVGLFDVNRLVLGVTWRR